MKKVLYFIAAIPVYYIVKSVYQKLKKYIR